MRSSSRSRLAADGEWHRYLVASKSGPHDFDGSCSRFKPIEVPKRNINTTRQHLPRWPSALVHSPESTKLFMSPLISHPRHA